MTLYKKIFKEFEKGFMGFAVLVILGQSCLSSATAMYILKNGTSLVQMMQLTFVVLMSMFVNAAILSQQKPKLVFNLAIMSVVSSVIFITLNICFS